MTISLISLSFFLPELAQLLLSSDQEHDKQAFRKNMDYSVPFYNKRAFSSSKQFRGNQVDWLFQDDEFLEQAC